MNDNDLPELPKADRPAYTYTQAEVRAIQREAFKAGMVRAFDAAICDFPQPYVEFDGMAIQEKLRALKVAATKGE